MPTIRPAQAPAARKCALLRERADILLSIGYAHAARVLYDRADLLEYEGTIQ